MYTLSKEIYFCYGRRLLNYKGKCAHPHGHNGKAVIELFSEKLDSRGMVRDFGVVKRLLREWINKTIDHKMVLNKKDPLVPVLEKLGEPYLAIDGNPTAESLAKLIYDKAKKMGFPVARVVVWETRDSFAGYSAP